MSLDPKSPQLPAEARDTHKPRRVYVKPCLKVLGTVRDLTLGSPKGNFTDGTFQMNGPKKM